MLEPAAIDVLHATPPSQPQEVTALHVAISQAISLKRIADALEKLAEPKAVPLGELREPAGPPMWQEWNGGKDYRGVPVQGRVRVRFRSGDELEDDASQFRWDDRHVERDIIAYRMGG